MRRKKNQQKATIMLPPNENEIILMALHKYLEVWIWLYHSCKTDFFLPISPPSLLSLLPSFRFSVSVDRSVQCVYLRLCKCGWWALVCANARNCFLCFFSGSSLAHFLIIICHSRDFVLLDLNGFCIWPWWLLEHIIYIHITHTVYCTRRLLKLNNVIESWMIRFFNPAYVWQRYSVHQ